MTLHPFEPEGTKVPQKTHTAADVFAAYKAGERSFINWNLTRLNLRNADLKDADFSGADMRGVDLSRCNLTRCNFTRANLHSAYLRGANLSQANLSQTNLLDCDVTDTDFSDVITDRPLDLMLKGDSMPQPNAPAGSVGSPFTATAQRVNKSVAVVNGLLRLVPTAFFAWAAILCITHGVYVGALMLLAAAYYGWRALQFFMQ